MVDLLDMIEWPSVECLNQHPSHNIGNALKQVDMDTAMHVALQIRHLKLRQSNPEQRAVFVTGVQGRRRPLPGV